MSGPRAVAGGDDVDGTPSIGGEGSLAWRTRIGNSGGAAASPTYRGWAGFQAMHGIPWPLLNTAGKPATGRFVWPPAAEPPLSPKSPLESQLAESVSTLSIAWSEYTLMLPGEHGTPVAGEVG